MHQRVEVIGHLGRDPEMRYTPAGAPVTNFSVAANRTFTNEAGNSVVETIWFTCSAWNRLAESCNQYLRKGSLVFIEGRLSPERGTGKPRIWTDPNGNPMANYELVVEKIKFLSPKEAGASRPAEAAEEPGSPEGAGDGEYPF